MVDAIKHILEIQISYVQRDLLTRCFINYLVHGLDLPLCAAWTPKPLLGGVQQSVPLAQLVEPIVHYR